VTNACAKSFSCDQLDTSDYGKFVLGQGVARFEALADDRIQSEVKTARAKYVGTRITGVELAANAKLTATGHPWVEGDKLRLDGFSGMHQLNGLLCTVAAAPSADDFKCTELTVDTTTFEKFVDDGKAMAYPQARTQTLLTAIATKVDSKGAAIDPRDNSCDHTGMDNKAATDDKHFYKGYAQCYDVLCPANYYADNTDGDDGCTSCPAFTTRRKGDKASDTPAIPFNYAKNDISQYCKHIQCPENSYRTATAGCAECAAGTFTDGKDDGVYESAADVCTGKSCPFASFAVNPFTSECEACPTWLKPNPSKKNHQDGHPLGRHEDTGYL
jgi:hypothetical protein